MNTLVSISNNGSIRILNIPLGVGSNYVMSVLRSYDIQENNNVLCINDFSTDNLPPLDIRFTKDNQDCIKRIYIGKSQLNQKECDKTFVYFKEVISSKLNIFSEEKNEVILSNTLHRVTIGKQQGLGDNEDKYPFFLYIDGKLLGKNEPELRYSMKQLYLEKPMQEKSKSSLLFSIAKTVKILIVALVLIIAYLFALNGRYTKIDDDFYFDKWTQTLLIIEKYKEISD